MSTVVKVKKVIQDIASTIRSYKTKLTSSSQVRDYVITKGFIGVCSEMGMLDTIQFAWLGEAGGIFRTSGIYTFWTKIIGMLGIDAGQTTSTSQPYVGGNIAPNEKLCLRNPNNGQNYLTHQTISFSAGDCWSVTTVLNWNGGYGCIYAGSTSETAKSQIFLNVSNNYQLFIYTQSGNLISISLYRSMLGYVGKNVIITIVVSGSNIISTYLNGILNLSVSYPCDFNFNAMLRGRSTNVYEGSLSAHIIRRLSMPLTQQQVTAEYNYLASVYPEIPNVTIGTQTWETSNFEACCTPQGNLIAEMQAGGNVEKITNGGFDTDTGWGKGPGMTISGGTLNYDGVSNSYCYTLGPSVVTMGVWHVWKFTIISGTARIELMNGGSTIIVVPLNNYTPGTYTIYFKSTIDGGVNIVSKNSGGGTAYSIDNVSVQQVGFSDSQNLFNYIYAQTAGTDEQKTYAACKAAAMWRHPNNDIALGAVYGKRYNRFAIKLLAMDLGYYNTANPSTPWGWDIPTEAQLTTLASQGGNALKAGGTNYWNTNNGTNATGLTLLGGGYVAADGTYVGLKSSERIWCKELIGREAKDGDDTFNEVATTTEGYSLRLIKI